MKITQHSAVTIHYRLSDQEGRLLEDSFDSEPMLYLHGTENLIPGLEAALDGKSKGEKLDVTISAEEAYGPYHDGLRQAVPLEAFGDIEDIVPGMRFIAETEMGQRPVQVMEVKDDVVIVDGNHPLAGQSLNFSVEIVDVREASAEEIAHGHIHAQGGCGSHGHDHDHGGGCCGGSGKQEAGGCCGGSDHDHGHHHEEHEACDTPKTGCDGNGGCGCRG
ncbi:peptidylprolyl isomerase [Shewanella sp. NKUCC05_KAH]|jgi:FKBP-type peptidyl-prolyl cis-trans isomerase SlyD|uniref:Peptidyl-prolyl cis-trans isomerase n=1 Tax=Shewanella oncorhynchi TaxID=2726434 RepID=A0AA50Q582_9GAMM|nr:MULTISPECIES: peptidylprolyl isomerase [Shewanella]GCF88095.1 peptidyl-prolyl cis-trans isomerase [Shewanella sp. M-Br]MBP6517469.1 peptidylprolyl isomerase [Shewanella sp.]MBS0042050.1 peptidylprolyl isomerase [Shewanella sp. M16]MBW3514342.1 peptidylprolyl isomerase [Shewanella sp. NKUCC01_JLK]MBW3525837.1 peptidylprolyl isomerase [Shewanella sp. NKUCC05_KAH]